MFLETSSSNRLQEGGMRLIVVNRDGKKAEKQRYHNLNKWKIQHSKRPFS